MADKTNTDPVRMEKIVSLCKRRGFIYQAGEIYGGLNGCWDYGPLGAELKRNLKEYWWRKNVQERDDVVGRDGLARFGDDGMTGAIAGSTIAMLFTPTVPATPISL